MRRKSELLSRPSAVNSGPNCKRRIVGAAVAVVWLSSVALAVEPRFEGQTIDDAIRIGYGVAIGEVDGDGHADILLADARQFVWYRNPGEAGKPWKKHVMAENLTPPYDNVCLAARDINGDGKVEVAVGARWNPGNTTDPGKSGAVFYLDRPDDPTQKWTPIPITPHDPTVHRMRWVKVHALRYQLAVLPLHGVGNKNGEGETVKLLLYATPRDPKGEWKLTRVDTKLHTTHNLEVVDPNRWKEAGLSEDVLVGGREGITSISNVGNREYITIEDEEIGRLTSGVGELRQTMGGFDHLRATIEPMHGNAVVAYTLTEIQPFWGSCILPAPELRRHVLDSSLKHGHAVALVPVRERKYPKVVAGWRMPNAQKKVGIRMYVPQDEEGAKWKTYTIDDNEMACEDMAVGDLDGDGKLDIVASGRMTRNVKVYWNRSGGE